MTFQKRHIPKRPLKRLFDIAFALAALVLTLPIWLFIVLAILLESIMSPSACGPVLYSEKRISGRRFFRLLKFRTCKVAAMNSARPEPNEDVRGLKIIERTPANLTRVGLLLQKTYLDELPQLLNILLGDLSVVGPRPWPMMEYESQLAAGIDTKTIIPCGLTGPVQSRKGEKIDGVQADLDYIDSYCTLSHIALLKLDLRIILRTFKIIRAAKGL
jgi:lipopolysaccharide/colanic/teichoic acid biosynthesis glycosyltransferase